MMSIVRGMAAGSLLLATGGCYHLGEPISSGGGGSTTTSGGAGGATGGTGGTAGALAWDQADIKQACLGQVASGKATAKGMAVDEQGNVLVVGSFTGTVTFGEGADGIELTSAGKSDAFLVKLDLDLNVLKAVRFGGVEEDSANAVATLGTDVFVAGDLSGSVDFSCAGGCTLAPVGEPNGSDVFLVKLDSDLNATWAKLTLGTDTDSMSTGSAYAVEVDKNRVYVSGALNGGHQLSVASCEMASGDPLHWAVLQEKLQPPCGNLADARPTGAALDGGNLYLSGSFQGSIVFYSDPQAQLCAGDTDAAFVARIPTDDLTTEYAFTPQSRLSGSGGPDAARDVALSDADVIVGGSRQAAMFEYQPSVVDAAFVAALDKNLGYDKTSSWALSTKETKGYQEIVSIAAHPVSKVAVAGNYVGAPTFVTSDDAPKTPKLPEADGQDVFVLLIDPKDTDPGVLRYDTFGGPGDQTAVATAAGQSDATYVVANLDSHGTCPVGTPIVVRRYKAPD